MKRCTNGALNGERSCKLLSRMVEGRIHKTASTMLRTAVIPKLRDDTVSQIIRFDWLIILYGNKLCLKYLSFQQYIIRSQLRLAGRLLIELKAMNNFIDDFASTFAPKFYDTLIDAVRRVTKFNDETNEFGSPSTAGSIMCMVKDVGAMLICEYIKQGNEMLQKQTEDFLKIVNVDASISIYKPMSDTLAKNQRLKVDRVPVQADVKIFYDYLMEEATKCFNRLEKKYSYSDWLLLNELTLTMVITFNRKRPGETQHILLSDYSGRGVVDNETIATLPQQDQLAAKNYSRIKLRGKKGRPVPALVNKEMEQYIESLIKHRKSSNIDDDNPYLFALPPSVGNKMNVIRACNTIRKFSSICGAADPKSLKCTMLRKQLANAVARDQLNDTEVSYVADFMGHHEKIHREYYRRMPIVTEIITLSKVLERAKGGSDNQKRKAISVCESVAKSEYKNYLKKSYISLSPLDNYFKILRS